MAKRKKLGDIIEIPLPNGKKAYARLYQEGTLGIFKGLYNSYSEVPRKVEYYRFICLYKSSLSKLEVVGARPFRENEDSYSPPKVMVDAITGKGSIYYHGVVSECTYEECKDLEIAAVWELPHLVEMLMGSTRIDDCMNYPKDV